MSIKFIKDIYFKCQSFLINFICLSKLYAYGNEITGIAKDAKDRASDVKKCKFGDEACFIEQFNYVLKSRKNGDSALGMVKMEPLDITKIAIKQPGGSVNVDLEFFNCKLYGLSNGKLVYANGPHRDASKATEFRAKGDVVTLLSNYKLNGRVLLLPIAGGGTSNMTIKNFEMRMKFNGALEERKGKEYYKIKKMIAELKIGHLLIDFENLFNGNKELSDNMNLFLNENWPEIWEEVKKPTSEALGLVFQAIIQNTLSRIPYFDLFD